MKKGVSVRLFLVDGESNGLKVIEKSNWSGRGIDCPRTLLPKIRGRSEFQQAGVYILVSDDSDAGGPTLYIGEGDPVGPRIDSHHREKDFWTKVIVFGRADNSLNKAHIQYLESSLIKRCKDAKRSKLDNGNLPAVPTLTESDRAEMDEYLEDMYLLLSVLGLTAFLTPEAARAHSVGEALLKLNGSGAEALGKEIPDGFIISKGSLANAKEVPSCNPRVKEWRAELLAKGILKEENGKLLFTSDYVFSSPSLAAAILMGRNANGRLEWRNEQNVTLKELQSASE